MKNRKFDMWTTKAGRHRAMRALAGLVVFATLLCGVAACSPWGTTPRESIARYGDDGANFARRIAFSYPRRVPYSNEEAKTADLLAETLARMGYEVERQSFTVTRDGVEHTSQNIIAHLEGHGFRRAESVDEALAETLPERIDDRLMIVGAHYDTPAVAVEPDAGDDEVAPTEPAPSDRPDGIHNNASGVAAVMTAAEQMLQEPPGYDVTFVFFGAGTDDYAGAEAFLKRMSEADKAKVDVMVNVGPIYAGDKVYAHAGQNSIESGDTKDYDLRRKLYQVTDIFFEYQLNTRNRYAIYTNQASFNVDWHGHSAIFREWTTKTSDHTPFDRAGIPIVFIESGEYRIESEAEVGLESRNPYFQSTGGVISGTSFDRTDRLEELFHNIAEQQARQTLPTLENRDDKVPTDPARTTSVTGTMSLTTTEVPAHMIERLPQRVNNTAFVLVKLGRKGPLHYEYDD